MTGDAAPDTVDLTGRRILVTGGAGFIGSHLVEALAAKNTVTVLDDCSTGAPENVPDDVEFVEGDVRDARTVRESIAGADLVYHLAALVSVGESVEQPTRSQSVNVEGTMQVLDAARREDARVVFASSAAIYGPPESVPVSESARKRPQSPYGVDKLAADHHARIHADLYDLPTVVLRYFNVYGPRRHATGDAGAVTTFLDQASAGAPLTIHGAGTQTRDFVHVDDVVQANLLAAHTGHVGQAFNVASGGETSILDLARRIREVTDAEGDIVYLDRQDGDIDRSRADLTKTREKLDYEPQVPLDTGLRRLAQHRKRETESDAGTVPESTLQ